MKLKKYLEFIKESTDSEIDVDYWSISNEDMMDYFLYLKDAGYIVYVYSLFDYEDVDIDGIGDNTYNDFLLDNSRPMTKVFIKPTDKIVGENINELISVYESIEARLGIKSNINIVSGGYYTPDIEDFTSVVIDDISLTNVIEYKGVEYEHIEIKFIEDKNIKFSDKDLFDEHGWKYDYTKDGLVYCDVSREDMVDYLINRSDDYYDILMNPDDIYDLYYSDGYYYRDINSLFSYYLDNENSRKLISKIIEEAGGLEEIINNYSDVVDLSEFKTEDSLIEFCLKERYHKTIEYISKDSEVMNDVIVMLGDFSMNAHVDTNLKEIFDSFEDIINDLFTYKKIKDEGSDYYDWKYRLLFEYKWLNGVISEYDDSEMKGYISGCGDMLPEYIQERHRLNPRLSDYGSVDREYLNTEISNLLD